MDTPTIPDPVAATKVKSVPGGGIGKMSGGPGLASDAKKRVAGRFGPATRCAFRNFSARGSRSG